MEERGEKRRERIDARRPNHGYHGQWAARVVAVALLLGLFCGAPAAETLKIGGSGSALGAMRLLGDEFTAKNPEVRVAIVPSLGSGGGIKAVAGGAVDLAVTSRPMTEGERKLGVSEFEYARTPFVVAVGVKTKITSVTRRELADIYAGKMSKWPDGSPVRIVLRPTSDIDTDMLRSLSPEIKEALAVAEKRPGVRFSVNDQDAADDLEKIQGAIGPSSLSLILSEKRALRALKLDGKDPTPENIASGSYPYLKRLFFVTAPKRSAAAERFMAFVRSSAGRKILTGHGHWVP